MDVLPVEEWVGEAAPSLVGGTEEGSGRVGTRKACVAGRRLSGGVGRGPGTESLTETGNGPRRRPVTPETGAGRTPVRVKAPPTPVVEPGEEVLKDAQEGLEGQSGRGGARVANGDVGP